MELCKDRDLDGIRQYKGVLKFSNRQLADRVKLYLEQCPHLLYRSDIVYHSGYGKSRSAGYVTEEKIPFGEVIANVLIDNELNIAVDKKCTYNSGIRKNITEKRRKDIGTFSARKAYCGNSETKLMHVLAMQETVGEYRVVDYQVPTTNGKADKIDIVLEKDGDIYITEAKRFGSSESLVRCVLEIETYYRKLNERFFEKYECGKSELKKAVLLDINSFAYRQFNSEWAKRLIKKFSIKVLILSETASVYTIEESQKNENE